MNGEFGPRILLSFVSGLAMTYPVYHACIGIVFPGLNVATAVLDLPASAKYEAYRPAWEKKEDKKTHTRQTKRIKKKK